MEKSRMYQFYELRDELKAAIQNLDKVEESEKLLVATLIGSPAAKNFEEFTKGLSLNWKRYESDRMTLRGRLKKVEKIIEAYEKRDETAKIVDEFVSLTLEAIGATKTQKSEA